MAASSLAPTDYSPPRGLPRLAVAVLAAVGLFGLWRGFAETYAAEPLETNGPPADAVSPQAARALPAASAVADTLIPPEAEPAAAPAPKAAAPANSAAPATLTIVETPTETVVVPLQEPGGIVDGESAPQPNPKLLDTSPAELDGPSAEEPPPPEDPYD